jgi:hypothetical protein
MKTLFTFIFGLSVGLLLTHYYAQTKSDYFNHLYTQYSQVNYNPISQQQFEQKWLSDVPWCFATKQSNYCNSATACKPENNEIHPKAESQLVHIHQKLINWYPKAQSALHQMQSWAVTTWEKQVNQMN